MKLSQRTISKQVRVGLFLMETQPELYASLLAQADDTVLAPYRAREAARVAYREGVAQRKAARAAKAPKAKPVAMPVAMPVAKAPKAKAPKAKTAPKSRPLMAGEFAIMNA